MFRKTFLILLGFFLSVMPIMYANAQEVKKAFNVDQLSSMVVLHEGRLKPFETYAKNMLVQFSGRSAFDRKPAVEWFAGLLFDPERTRSQKIFLINNPAIAESLQIEAAKNRKYSFDDLKAVFPKLQELATGAQSIEAKERGVVENELIRIYQNIQLYSKLSLNFSFAQPIEVFSIKNKANRELLGFNPDREKYSYIDVALRANQLQKVAGSLEKKAKSKWTAQDKELLQLMANLFQWSLAYRDLPLRIIPDLKDPVTTWYSPWDAVPLLLKSTSGREEISYLRDAVYAYQNVDQVKFNLSLKKFNQSVEQRYFIKAQKKFSAIDLELLYNHLNGFLWAKILYLLSFFMFLFWMAWPKNFLYKFSIFLSVGGSIFHLMMVVLRCIILMRPPVSNLYDTFVFVGLISVLTGFLIERITRNGLGTTIASISGFAFLMIAAKFAAEGDTLQMLVAVLDSNFWLSTHVISITIGYSGACVAAIVGHVYILQAIMHPHDKALLKKTNDILLGTLGFGLIMTFLGTNLGGIWADQSWGRFWGWDPKENGAMMIVLWIALLFHARLGGIVKQLGLAVGSALGLVVVMWAWFGVNLLSVGLHSYGFTSGLATNLLIYLVCQIIFLIVAVPIAQKRLLAK